MARHRRVRHRIDGYTGVVLGTTRLKHLFENPTDEVEERVKLANGEIRIASPSNLIELGEVRSSVADYRRFLGQIPEVIDDINEQRIPNEWLVDGDTWSEICRARGQHFNLVDPEAWSELCRRRGYLLYRQDSRGF